MQVQKQSPTNSSKLTYKFYFGAAIKKSIGQLLVLILVLVLVLVSVSVLISVLVLALVLDSVWILMLILILVLVLVLVLVLILVLVLVLVSVNEPDKIFVYSFKGSKHSLTINSIYYFPVVKLPPTRFLQLKHYVDTKYHYRF